MFYFIKDSINKDKEKNFNNKNRVIVRYLIDIILNNSKSVVNLHIVYLITTVSDSLNLINNLLLFRFIKIFLSFC